MRTSTIRLFIVIASLLIMVIISVQVYWLNKTYKFEKNEFNTSVIKSIRGVYEDLPLLYETSDKLQTLIEKKDANTYLFRVDSIPLRDSLLYYIHTELEDFDVFTDCKVTAYNYLADQIVFEAYLPSAASGNTTDTRKGDAVFSKNYSYVSLYFPHRDRYIIQQMTGWILTSGLLLLMLLGLAASLYYFFKQKFLVEVQKDFINNVTHEFSTPLSVIELSVEGLSKPALLTQPEKYEKYINAIRYQVDYLKSHITKLVKTVVVDRYHVDMKMDTLAPNDLIRRAAAQLEPVLQKKAGIIEWKPDENNSKLIADEENLYLALFNILSNAIKYSAHPKIIISTAKNHSRYFISVKDNGIGIEASQIKKIFKKFYRVQNGNVHDVKGLGLGLYFTKKVIEGHKGKIEVNSIPGIGTEFKIDLPLI
jgi:two-component system phosphate regulon sensor histidine kinase PhoR